LTLWPIIRARFPEACSSAGLWEQVFSASIHGLVTCFAALPSTLANALPNLVPEVEVSRVRSTTGVAPKCHGGGLSSRVRICRTRTNAYWTIK